jgi:hypothetical protein
VRYSIKNIYILKFPLKKLFRTYNYALEETIRLMENLVGRPKEDIEDKKGMVFSNPLL